MNLHTATVTGFFSLPSASLAEHNPAAYNAAMAGAPVGAGSCAACGTGIRHHVVCRLECGRTVFIGTDCATKVGGQVARCAGQKLTSEQLAARDTDWQARQDAWKQQEEIYAAKRAERSERFADVIACLNSQGSEFHRSLANQIPCGTISEKQANYVVKAFFGRENKKNSDAYWQLKEDLTNETI